MSMVIACGRPLTSTEAADYLQKHRITVLEMAKEGRLRGYKNGKEWRFYREDLDAFVKGGNRDGA